MEVFRYSPEPVTCDSDVMNLRHAQELVKDTRVWNLLYLSIGLDEVEELPQQTRDELVNIVVRTAYTDANGNFCNSLEPTTVAYYMGLTPKEAISYIVRHPKYKELPLYLLLSSVDENGWLLNMMHRSRLPPIIMRKHPLDSDPVNLDQAQEMLRSLFTKSKGQ